MSLKFRKTIRERFPAAYCLFHRSGHDCKRWYLRPTTVADPYYRLSDSYYGYSDPYRGLYDF